jgi:hypothetical protein
MLLGLPDLHPDPLVVVTSTDPDPAQILTSSSKNSKKTHDFYCSVISI